MFNVYEHTLGALAGAGELEGFLARLEWLPKHVARDELCDVGASGFNAIHCLLYRNASFELLLRVMDVMSGDEGNRNQFGVATTQSVYPLHYCINFTTDIRSLHLVITKYPKALLEMTDKGASALWIAVRREDRDKAEGSTKSAEEKLLAEEIRLFVEGCCQVFWNEAHWGVRFGWE